MSRREPEPLRSSRLLEAVARWLRGLVDGASGRAPLEASARREREPGHGAGEPADELERRLRALAREPRPGARPVQLDALLGAVERTLGGCLGEKVGLRVEPAPGLGVVHVDPLELEQAVLDLLLDARAALPRGGELRLTTGRVEITPGTPGALAPGRYVALRVSNDAAGTDAEPRASRFEGFFVTRALERGSALGLPRARAFVTQAGGAMHVRSGLGVGTTVELLLPENDAPSAGAAV